RVTPGDQADEARAPATARRVTRNHARHDARCECPRIRAHMVVDDQPRGITDRPVENFRAVEERPAAEEVWAYLARLERPQRPAAHLETVREKVVRAARRHGALGGHT